jgi:hypothetical protein
MLGHRAIGEAALGELTVQPAQTPKGLRKQLQQMRKELPPSVLKRWGHVIDAAISQQNAGRPPEDITEAMKYMQAQVDQGRDLDDPKLATETAREMLCSRKTAERARKKIRERQN